MNIEEFISLMQTADLSKLSYDKIKSIVINNEIQFPFITTLIRKGTPIDRGRLNSENTPFYYSEFEISYRTDLGNIREFGRANEPYHSRFYGSLPSNEIKLSRVVLFAELEENFRIMPKNDFEATMTLGRWIVKEDFEVADVCFSNKYMKNNEIKERYEAWLVKLKDSEVGQDQYVKLLEFFSDEFAKTGITSHHDYKLSSIYSDYAIHNNLKGLLYPSVKTDYYGANIVLIPYAVEKYLELTTVAMFKYKVEDGKATLFPLYYSEDLGPFNTRFQWKKFEEK